MTITGATDKAVQIYGDADKDCEICFKYGISLTESAEKVVEKVSYYLKETPATLIIPEHIGIGYTTKIGKYRIRDG